MIDESKFILDVFTGREDWVAYQKPSKHFQPHKLTKPLTPEKFSESHLSQKTSLGFYLLSTDNTCKVSCADYDHHGKNPQAIQQGIEVGRKLEESGFSPVYEISSSGEGIHVWLIFEEPIQGWLVRKFWNVFLETYFPKHSPDLYPAQNSLEGLKLGNLVRYPLWNKSRFISPNEPDASLSTEEVEKSLVRTTEDSVKAWLLSRDISVESPSDSVTEPFTSDYEGVVDGFLPDRIRNLVENSPGSLLTCRWMAQTQGLYDGSYSGIMMSLIVEMVRAYLPTDEIREAVEYWCRLRGYEKPLERPHLIDSAIGKAYDLIVDRKEKKVLTGNTFDTLAHDYADVVYRNEDILVPTGIKGIDDSVGGFGFGELAVISGRPSQGKTAFSLQCLDHASLVGFPGLLISLEMSARENSRRFLLRLSQGNTAEWKTEQGNNFLHQKISDHFKNRMPIYFVEGTYEINRIEEVIDHYAQEYGVRFVVLDYQGLADARDQQGEYAKQTEITKRLKKTARRNDISLASLVQMKRVEGDNPDREPQLSDLRASGEIEQSADLVLFTRWPWKDDTSRPKHEYLGWLKKSRNREIKEPRVELFFDSQVQTFR